MDEFQLIRKTMLFHVQSCRAHTWSEFPSGFFNSRRCTMHFCIKKWKFDRRAWVWYFRYRSYFTNLWLIGSFVYHLWLRVKVDWPEWLTYRSSSLNGSNRDRTEVLECRFCTGEPFPSCSRDSEMRTFRAAASNAPSRRESI